MKILHVWEQAGATATLAKWQAKSGHQVKVLKQAKHDQSGIGRYYNVDVIDSSRALFVLQCFKTAKDYDIIHLHDAWWLVHAVRLAYPTKKIIMHYHGSLVRSITKFWQRATWETFCDKIILATPDLLEFRYIKEPLYVPNPIDIELFKPKKIDVKKGVGFSSLKSGMDKESLQNILRSNGFNIELVVQDINEKKSGKVTYEMMPEILSSYEYYVDIPIIDGKIVHANSMTGLQAMALGVKVICHDFSVKSKLPEENNPDNVLKMIDRVYSQL